MAHVLKRTLLEITLKKPIWHGKEYSIIKNYSNPKGCNNNKNLLNNSCKVVVNIPKQYFSNDKKEEPKLTLFQKFKAMYRDYWYVLVPVHLVTSTMWFGGFYYMAKSGIDIVGILESWHVSEKVVNPLRDSSMGYVAVAYACYKIATPARYTVTLGGTTISINYLKKWGYIKPVPSTERMKEIYQNKKRSVAEGIKEKKENLMESIQETKEGIKEKKDNIIETVKKTTEQKKPCLKIKEKSKPSSFKY